MRQMFGRDRLTGQFAVAAAGLLVVGAVVFGVGEAGAKYHIADVGAWLGAGKKGLVVHANGLAGKVDGKGKLPRSMSGHQIKIVQNGPNVMIVDLQTGVVARVDPSTFDIGGARKLGDAAGLDLVAGTADAYAIDQVKGTVQRIDPVTLGAVGGPVRLTAPLGGAAIDAKGILWVPEGNTGQVVPFQSGRAGSPVMVGRPGDTLSLTVAAGVPVVTDSTQAAATVVGLSGPLMRVNLPSTVRNLLAPITSDGQLVPLLAPEQGALVVLNAGNGTLSSTRIDLPRGHRFEPPQSLGPRVYIPDTTAGSLLVYDTATGRFEKPVGVPGAQGKRLEVFVKDGLLWVNNPDGPDAVVVNTTGQPTTIGKYDANVPGGGKHPIPRGGTAGPRPSVPPVPTPPQPTQPATTPPPWAAPAAPTTINATPGAGTITVTFQPSAGGTPTGYVVKDAAGAAVTARPARITPGSGTTFTVSGGSCGQEYRFVVAVQYLDRNKRPAEVDSQPSVPVRPCVTPGTPTGFTATAVNHGAKLSWTAASGGGGTPVYALSGPGAPAAVSGTSTDATGLTNGSVYTYKLTARTGAGESDTATASANLDPALHTRSYAGWHNGPTNTWLHSDTSGTTASRTVEWPVDYSSMTTVICQTTGANMQDNPGTGQWSTIWDKIRYNGAIQWVSDLYIHTPNSASGTYSSAVWNCG
jgi:hypothetical protein